MSRPAPPPGPVIPPTTQVIPQSGEASAKLPLGGLLAILASALTGTGAELCLKLGALHSPQFGPHTSVLAASGLENKWVWFSIAFTLLGFLTWIRAIRAIPLTVAFALANVVHVFVPLSCWLLLGEVISARRWWGIALLLIGLAIVARPFAQLDGKLEDAL